MLALIGSLHFRLVTISPPFGPFLHPGGVTFKQRYVPRQRASATGKRVSRTSVVVCAVEILASWHLGELGKHGSQVKGQTTRLRARGGTQKNTTRDTTDQPVRSLVCITGWSMGCLRRHGSFSKHRSSSLAHCEYRHSPCRSQGSWAAGSCVATVDIVIVVG